MFLRGIAGVLKRILVSALAYLMEDTTIRFAKFQIHITRIVAYRVDPPSARKSLLDRKGARFLSPRNLTLIIRPAELRNVLSRHYDNDNGS